ncbi:DUF1836 domain-containing protein [Salisediminibacterium selenitireducens]|uniref:DUF1836 domain-containing protein n=1 Tax=Bacillus selenitireducens (strain ATCC 700615 / DSM 15326 / MLS10) TaxID=439292 RepID=D6XXE3_BACIE|nr:DUF1836 domain-containing protein [Salisediminibacterium selenitireducens]ADH98000.1 Domain of unknown function DUF1836 [[Bacillus] selenitireducens MLS10]
MTKEPSDSLGRMIRTEDIPTIDLYMDQIIQLFEQTFADTKRDKSDKIMTKTMINNYAKGGLLFPIQKKRYSREHIMLIALIYELKGILSVHDIKTALRRISREGSPKEMNDVYSRYLKLADENLQLFKDEISKHKKRVESHILEMETDEEVQDVLMILACVNMSNLYRRMAEELIDDLADPDEDSL